ncbi:MAG TPA: hypothetical protein VK980_08670 [Sphingomonas sp.]|nr:hypothetical protein [Sphingomonas sp.]
MLKPLLATLTLLIAAAPADPAHPAALVGEYDGHQMEMAAGLELKADGRFQYGLSYGALDEEAEGSWAADHGSVVLTSDHVTPPRFTLVEQKAGPAKELRIAIDVPHGMNPQYFDAVVAFADGHVVQEQLSEDEKVIPLANGAVPTRVMIVLSIFDLHGDWVAVDPAKGNRLRFGFEANDLGKVDFHGAALRNEGGDLLLDRYGRTIRFHRVAKQ